MSIVGNFTTSFDRSFQIAGPGGLARVPTGLDRDLREADDDGEQAVRRARQQEEKLERAESVTTLDEEADDAHIRELATLYSRRSVSEGYGDPFDASEDSVLNPHSPSFNARAWAKALVQLEAQDEPTARKTAGLAFRNLSAFGYAQTTDYQMTTGNALLKLLGAARRAGGGRGQRIDILQHLDGLVTAGEMLVVLGPPGSGCSTFLKTVAGETHGFQLAEGAHLNYRGISFEQMHHDFRGEAIYTAEQDVHFPMLTVGDTLTFAARARAPRRLPRGLSVDVFTQHLRDVVMAIFGIRHTINTKVGNDYVRGVSGGERKRVSIAEATLSGAPLQCWDNSTRGLDSANAIEFCRTLRLGTELGSSTAAVAIYQAPQMAYDLFDKVLLLYEGHQIYFGRTTDARAYFEAMGFDCPEQQTTPDFLTSMTSPKERVIRPGWAAQVPRTADEFAQRWKASAERKVLLEEIDAYDRRHPIGGSDVEEFKEARRLQQSKAQRIGSPYTLSYMGQIKLCLWRGFRRLVAEPTTTISGLLGNFAMALIVGSIFYNLQPDTASFNSRGSLLFFAILLNAFSAALEILTLYAQRPIIEKHARYAFYHPSAEAFASMLTDLPSKILNAICFNLVIYFITNLRREPGAFFFFLLITFTLTLVMSMFFRTVGSLARSMAQAQTPAALLILALVIYTGFAIPVPSMLGWARWINYLDPVAYGFEALLINEFSGRTFACSQAVPFGPGYNTNGVSASQVCAVVGSVAGQSFVDGDAYIATFEYYAIHKWRNYGILWAFLLGLMGLYLLAAEFVSASKSKGEVLLFRRGHMPAHLEQKMDADDLELARRDTKLVLEKSRADQDISTFIQRQTAIFHWANVCYDIKIKGEPRRILDHVDGWVKPGTMTALMGVSGAGKTTLLDVLASRVTMGVITGDMLVDGRPRDDSFQRKTGYVQQQDLHLETSTVREALNFSAILRQPASVPRSEKLDYVNEVIKLLEMEEYADAVIGVPGEGLNVEQRKRLTIGVEMAAKPQLLLFLDEPTSGLDSQTSWSILNLLEKLTKNGQAILCTIHQPSAMLFQRFDRLLLLAAGGKTVYFGPIGENSATISSYFEKQGADSLPSGANPAEWILEVIGAAPGVEKSHIDWHQAWRESSEYQEVHKELDRIKQEGFTQGSSSNDLQDKAQYREFAAPLTVQFWEVQKRVFQQYYRSPTYIYSKLALTTLVSLFIGFSFFKAPNSQQGLKNQLYGVFMLLSIFNQLVQQIMPLFVTQRSLYEVRERPSKTYSWKAFMITNIIVEIPWATLCAILVFCCWYYPIGLYNNAVPTDAVTLRGFMAFLFIWQFMLLASTFAFLIIAGLGTAETAGNIGNLLFSMTLIFCGALVSPSALPGFWIFMYRVSPMTYLVESFLTTALANAPLICAADEFRRFAAPAGQTCGQYMQEYISLAGGYLADANATDCQFCDAASTNVFLSSINMSFDHAWRNFGILWVYIAFNAIGAVVIYWLARVPKKGKAKKE